MKDLFQQLYKAYRPIKSLPTYQHGDFAHGKAILVATIPAEGDGQTVEVYEERLPARFFTLKVLAGPNSVGEMKPGYELVTGGGEEMGELAGQIAGSIANGMLVYRGTPEK